MLSQTSETHAEPPSLRRFRGAYWFGGFNGLTWMMGLGTPMVLLTEQLGGSAFQVGLASSFVLLLFPLQVLATSVLPYFGFRRQMVLAWSARAVFLLIPLGLAFRAPEVPADWMPGAVVFRMPVASSTEATGRRFMIQKCDGTIRSSMPVQFPAGSTAPSGNSTV